MNRKNKERKSVREKELRNEASLTEVFLREPLYFSACVMQLDVVLLLHDTMQRS